jgi:hypothetical protein
MASRTGVPDRKTGDLMKKLLLYIIKTQTLINKINTQILPQYCHSENINIKRSYIKTVFNFINSYKSYVKTNPILKTIFTVSYAKIPTEFGGEKQRRK